MLLKKSFSILLTIIFVCTTLLIQFSWAADASQSTLLKNLAQVETALYGQVQEKPLIERVESLEKELVGRTLPGTITSRVEQLKEFIILGTPEDTSINFKINVSQWILEDKITSGPIANRIENLENVLFGEISDDVLAMRAESIFGVCFKEGKPTIEEVIIPSGTLIPIRFQSTISSKDSVQGDIFTYQVVKDMFIGNKLVIPAETSGVGEIIKVKKATILSRPGELELNFNIIPALDGTPLNLIMGKKSEEENQRLYMAVGAGILGFIILSNPVGLAFGALIPGKNVEIEQGTEMFLQLESDVSVIGLIR
ncbi:MAG: hypothetical protein U9N03_04455 [Candidatus Caldatribacteriota bacterium]|nr:hypothetical protein [Candidatus Caldatribacteriota bacterium]